jgi:hypothetical protein
MAPARHPAQRRHDTPAVRVRRLVEEACNDGNLAVLDAVLAPASASSGAAGVGLRDLLTAFRAAVPDARWTIVEQISQGEHRSDVRAVVRPSCGSVGTDGRKEKIMQHARVGVYKLQPGTVEEVIRWAQDGMVPTFRSQPGFVGYGLIKTAEDAVISLSLWQTSEEADAAVQTAATWVRENLAGMVDSVQNYVGDLAFFSSTAPIGS